MIYNIELYKENGHFCAYIGEDNGSGYEVYGDTEKECASKIAQFFEEYGNWDGEEELSEEED